MNTKDALLFIRLAESQSFKEAAKQMNVSRATASKRLAALEKEFGTVLIYRNARSISLTQAGISVLEQCRIICDAVDSAKQAVQGHGLQPVGTLHLALPTSLGMLLMPCLTREFACSYPKLHLSVHFIDGQMDIIGNGIDLAIQMCHELDDSSLVSRRLATTRQVLVASPGYLQTHGMPETLEDIAKHACLGVGYASEDTTHWHFSLKGNSVEVPVNCQMTSNNFLALKVAACMDMGLLYVPELVVKNDIRLGRLKVVFPEQLSHNEWGIYAVYPDRRSSHKIIALIDFLKARISQIEMRGLASDGHMEEGSYSIM